MHRVRHFKDKEEEEEEEKKKKKKTGWWSEIKTGAKLYPKIQSVPCSELTPPRL
jgi:hypothetical protein